MKDFLEGALEFARSVARQAGSLQKERYESANLGIERKGVINIVTEVDIACEKLITSAIAEKYPHHGILAEEGTESSSTTGYVWIIDPLDGTTNYAHGFPMFAPSIALAMDGEPLLGAVYDPMRDEMFTGMKGGGAWLNGKAVKVSSIGEMDGALLATGFPYDIRTNPNNNLANFNRVALKCQAIRRAGSAALDLCYTACGRFDGFWEQSLYAWDMAAGALFVMEAGGVVTDMEGNRFNPFVRTVCAANPVIHPQILPLLKG